MIKKYWLLCIIMIPSLLSAQTSNGNPQLKDANKRNLQADADGAGVLTEEEDFVLIKYTLQEAAFVAERRGIKIGLECHAQYSKTPDGLDRIYHLVDSPCIGINLDTGNAYLAGQDPYAWVDRVAERLVHLHAKDISVAHSDAERGQVTGTPVGCACGDGVLDWSRIVGIVKDKCPRDIVFSVECGTPEQAKRSLEHLSKLAADGMVSRPMAL